MDITSLAIFAVALLVAAASPGPTTAALVARVLARGTGGALAFMLGIALGDVLWLACAVLGLAVIAKSFGLVFVVLKYLGAAYLLYLAWRLWTTPASPYSAAPPAPENPARLFAAGVTLMLGNPKVMVFYLALLPNIIDLAAVSALGFAELAIITILVVMAVDGAYVATAAQARRLLRSPRAVRLINRGSGAVMAGAAVAIAAR